MKKFYCIIFFILILSINQALARQSVNTAFSPAQTQTEYISKSEFPISSINPTPATNPPGAYYPGIRGGNQLIIYTPEYGQRTGTNEYGKEAIVINNTITALTGANSFIPRDGFVISGHGIAKDWIDKNLKIGATIKIYPEQKIIESMITPESYTFQANQKIEQVQKTIFEYKIGSIEQYSAKESEKYLEQAREILDKSKFSLVNKNYDSAKELANESADLANKALYYAIPARSGEFSVVSGLDQQKKALQKLQKR